MTDPIEDREPWDDNFCAEDMLRFVHKRLVGEVAAQVERLADARDALEIAEMLHHQAVKSERAVAELLESDDIWIEALGGPEPQAPEEPIVEDPIADRFGGRDVGQWIR